MGTWETTPPPEFPTPSFFPPFPFRTCSLGEYLLNMPGNSHCILSYSGMIVHTGKLLWCSFWPLPIELTPFSFPLASAVGGRYFSSVAILVPWFLAMRSGWAAILSVVAFIFLVHHRSPPLVYSKAEESALLTHQGTDCHGLGQCDNAFQTAESFFPQPLGHTYVPAAPIELVLARFRENLTWLSAMPFPMTVYDHAAASARHYVPNMAAESSCYVKYILDRYYTLPNVSVFLQAGGLHHNWRIREWIQDLKPDMQHWVHLNSDPPNSCWWVSRRKLAEVCCPWPPLPAVCPRIPNGHFPRSVLYTTAHTAHTAHTTCSREEYLGRHSRSDGNGYCRGF